VGGLPFRYRGGALGRREINLGAADSEAGKYYFVFGGGSTRGLLLRAGSSGLRRPSTAGSAATPRGGRLGAH